MKQSFVLWRDYIPPLIAIELATGNGEEERDRTPLQLAERLWAMGINPDTLD